MEWQYLKTFKILTQNRKNTESDTSDTNATMKESTETDARKQQKKLLQILL